MRANCVVMTCLLLWCASSGTVHAAGHPEPDPEFLEFLGSWETGNGEWIDPMELLDPSMEIRDAENGSEEPRDETNLFWPFGDEPEKPATSNVPISSERGGHE